MEDWKYQRQRADLIGELRRKGITDERVLTAMGAVPRHLFMDEALAPRAYEDEALPIGYGQTISQPFTVAYQTMMLNPVADDRILEIGTGSGYQAAILCEMGARVFSVERIRPLYENARKLLEELGYRVVSRFGDGTRGWESMSPFDGIVVTAGAPVVPEALLAQLRLPEGMKQGGRLIIPVGDRSEQKMHRIVRMGEEEWETEVLDGFRFVPLLGETSD